MEHRFLTQQALKSRTTLMVFVALTWGYGIVYTMDGAELSWLIKGVEIKASGYLIFVAIATAYYAISYHTQSITDADRAFTDAILKRDAKDKRMVEARDFKSKVSRFTKATIMLRDKMDMWLPQSLGIIAVGRAIWLWCNIE